MTDVARTEDESHKPWWYRRMINILAAVLLFFLWHWAAWAAAKWLGQSEDHWFLGIVAVTVALNLPSRRKP